MYLLSANQQLTVSDPLFKYCPLLLPFVLKCGNDLYNCSRCLALHVLCKPRRKKGKSFVSGHLTFLCATLKACLVKLSFTAAVGVWFVLVHYEWHDVSAKRWKWEAVLINQHWMGLGPVCQLWNYAIYTKAIKIKIKTMTGDLNI